MAQPRKVSITMPDGRVVQGTEVGVDTSNERWSEYKLEDGTVFRCKVNVISVVRLEGEYDTNGAPLYQMNGVPAIALIESPPGLMRKSQQ